MNGAKMIDKRVTVGHHNEAIERLVGFVTTDILSFKLPVSSSAYGALMNNWGE
jgi:hypothetical protein